MVAALLFLVLILALPILWQGLEHKRWHDAPPLNSRLAIRTLLIQIIIPLVYFGLASIVDPDKTGLIETGMGKVIDALICLAIYCLGYIAALVGFISISHMLIKRNQALTAIAKNNGNP